MLIPYIKDDQGEGNEYATTGYCAHAHK